LAQIDIISLNISTLEKSVISSTHYESKPEPVFNQKNEIEKKQTEMKNIHEYVFIEQLEKACASIKE